MASLKILIVLEVSETGIFQARGTKVRKNTVVELIPLSKCHVTVLNIVYCETGSLKTQINLLQIEAFKVFPPPLRAGGLVQTYGLASRTRQTMSSLKPLFSWKLFSERAQSFQDSKRT
jgi:hypothetical protein